MLNWLFDNKNDKKTKDIEKELHDVYGYSRKELENMTPLELETALYDEYEEDDEMF